MELILNNELARCEDVSPLVHPITTGVTNPATHINWLAEERQEVEIGFNLISCLMHTFFVVLITCTIASSASWRFVIHSIDTELKTPVMELLLHVFLFVSHLAMWALSAFSMEWAIFWIVTVWRIFYTGVFVAHFALFIDGYNCITTIRILIEPPLGDKRNFPTTGVTLNNVRHRRVQNLPTGLFRRIVGFDILFRGLQNLISPLTDIWVKRPNLRCVF
ncbi:hypothetical protein ABY42_18750 (plasmid) [Haloferax gibbonsii]|uniref:Uncharacterized protein n=1 Tax=Haloferax gibbonsii TaxID=35746 RepID=A0A0K1IZI2_HALGI|nr:hypothetical protein ABY42_18750 [Haloferax gibbonsii]